MDNSPAFDWNQARAFLTTAEAGSLSAAARRLGLTQPTLGRQVAAIEADLGVALFERVGRSLVLTEAGAALLPHVRAMGEASEEVALAAAAHSDTLEGEVVISATDIASALVLPPVMLSLRRRAPGLRIGVVSDNRLSDLKRREADIAIRHTRPEDPGLYARKLKSGRAHLYGAPAYFDRMARPRSVPDLARAEFVGVGDPDDYTAFFTDIGWPITPAQVVIWSNSGLAAWALVRMGAGLMVMTEGVARATGGVERLLPEMEPVEVSIWLVTHRELKTSARIRLAFDHIAEAFENPDLAMI
jgi:DNA-binding transcriptional LysR family regulator